MGKKWISDLGDGTYQNPVLFADYSDPDVIRVGDDFYMTASTFTYVPGLPILHSKDLVNWEVINYAVKRLPDHYDKPVHGCGVWAPSIRYHAGKFWIYYGDPDFGIFMTNTEDPYGEWSELVLVKEGKGLIDTCPLWDDDGKAYIVHAYANSRCGIKSKLAVCEMSCDGTKAIGEDQIIFDGTVSHPTLEGPKFYKRDDWYYIMAPAGGVKPGWQSVFRSKSVYGPYEDRIVLRQGLTEINGPHQGGYVELENGEGWFVHFQDRDEFGRVVHLQPVQWINGWPAMGENVDSGLCGQPVLRCRKPDVGNQYPIKAPATSDDFSGEQLGLQWQWQANPREDYYSLSERKGFLRLKGLGTSGTDSYIRHLPNVLSQLWQAPEMTVTVAVEVPTADTYAGIVILGLSYHSLAVTNAGKLVMHEGEADTQLNAREECILRKQAGFSKAFLRAEIAADGMYQFSYSADGEKFEHIGSRYKAAPGHWVGAKTGLFCVGGREGYADFAEFTVN